MPAAKRSPRAATSAPASRVVATRFLLDGTRFQYVAIMSASKGGMMRTAPGYQPPSLVDAQDDLFRTANSNLELASQPRPQAVRKGIYGGFDERTKLPDTTKFPYSTITALSMWNYDEASDTWPHAGYCSGSVVANKHILTAGHCIWDDSGWVRGVIATPGKNGENNPWGQWWCSSLTTFTGFKKNDETYDMGVVTCADKNKYGNNVGAVGWMGRKWPDTAHSGIKNTAGYPGDKYLSRPSEPYGTFNTAQWSTSCKLPSTDSVTDRIVKHPCDTTEGQSGSPMWDKMSDGSRYIRGVAVRACTVTCASSDYNEYTPLNKALGDTINKIVSA